MQLTYRTRNQHPLKNVYAGMIRALISLLCLAGMCAAQTREERWRQDLQSLEQQILSRHPNPFTKVTRTQFSEEARAIADSIPQRTDVQLAAEAARLVAMIGDAHTSLGLTQANARATFLPLRVRWFPDGLYVTQAAEIHARAIGKRILRVGNKTAEECFDILRRYVSHENENWARLISANYFISPEILEAAGIVDAVGPVTYGFEDFELTIPPAALGLVNAPYLSRPKFPLYRRNTAQPYWFDYLSDARTVYVQYNQCRETPALPFAQFTRELIVFIESNPVDRIVFDFRNNGGGNSAILTPLLQALGASFAAGKFLPSKGSYLLIGRQTFSSASLNTAEIKAQGATILIGEPTGGGASGFGEVVPFQLPNSQLTGQISTRLFTIPGFPGSSIAPDIAVELTAADYFADNDPVLQKALELPAP
ncbi:MAG: hypothetical protein JNK48_20680 [Bryobacterales bacterium]|nr:hypothetical protein [Bryobacterales bacterium]